MTHTGTPALHITRLKLSQTSRPLDVFAYWKKELYLDLAPPYQRGEVWGPVRKTNLIRSILLGVPIPSIIVNDRFAAGWGEEIAVIDGKQRLTAILNFLESELQVPGAWFGENKSAVTFKDLPIATQRHFRNIPIQVVEGTLPSLAAEIEVFELVNFGGVPQGQTDYA